MPLNLAKRLALIRSVAGDLHGKRVLDCGCGAGDYVHAFSTLQAAAAVGVEYQAAKLWGRERRESSAQLAAADVERLPFPDDSFQLAIANEMLEHVPDDASGLLEMRRVLEPGGLLVVFSPNRLYPFETHGVSLKRSGRKVPHYVPAIPYIPLRVGHLWLRYWARNYWPWELRRRIGEAGFAIEKRAFVWQTFENISGHQPQWMTHVRGSLRRAANLMESTPGLRWFGVSQMLAARR